MHCYRIEKVIVKNGCVKNIYLSREDSHLFQVVSNSKLVLVGVQSPTEINAPRGCTVILQRICQLTLTRITRQVSRLLDLNLTVSKIGVKGRCRIDETDIMLWRFKHMGIKCGDRNTIFLGREMDRCLTG